MHLLTFKSILRKVQNIYDLHFCIPIRMLINGGTSKSHDTKYHDRLSWSKQHRFDEEKLSKFRIFLRRDLLNITQQPTFIPDYFYGFEFSDMMRTDIFLRIENYRYYIPRQ